LSGTRPTGARPFYAETAPGRFDASPATAGPWSLSLQHGGPPSALALRAVERLPGAGERRVARAAVDILRPVPVGPLEVAARVVRPGRRVELVEATVLAEAEPALRLSAWRVARAPGDVAATARSGAPPPRPASATPLALPGWHTGGYLSAVEWRFAAGSFATPGPATAWARPLLPLLAGEEMTPEQRTLLLADSGSGLGAAVDLERWLAINVDLVVTFRRAPRTGWLCLRATTSIVPGEGAVTETEILDEQGPAARATQVLLVEAR
jgi:acyl-coenzyme A thioesterase PaaI-like protein